MKNSFSLSRGLLMFAGCWLLLAGLAGAQTWNPAWSDEFSGAANSPIDSSKWQFETGILNVNNEAEYYCAPGSSTSPCSAGSPNAYIDGNGHLVIQAIEINSSIAPYSGSWTSARLNTANNLASFKYGRIESSMQLPDRSWIVACVLGARDGHRDRRLAHFRRDRLHGECSCVQWARADGDPIDSPWPGIFRRRRARSKLYLSWRRTGEYRLSYLRRHLVSEHDSVLCGRSQQSFLRPHRQ